MAADSERWAKEQEFFDDEEYDEGPIPANTIERYRACRHPFTPAEFPFALLGDVAGKRIFELGCGDGVNSILLALKGAHVVGVDISPRAIAIAQEKAKAHGVEDRTEFFALPVEAYLEQAASKFDIICGFAVLHHLLPVLDEIMTQLKQLGHPGTTYLFTEPIALSQALRKFRLALPLPTHATPDERPLEPRDIDILQNALPGLKLYPQLVLGRFWNRFIGGRVEDYSLPGWLAYRTVCHVDQALLALPGSKALAASAVLYSPSTAKQ